ncbi:MAG TPA: hypothetical protein VMW76_05975 [Bacteroidales bacterium]|nr:hypothetical protein [Bacteroidales bacterium]
MDFMGRVGLKLLAVVTITIIGGCKGTSDKSDIAKADKEVIQQSDGNILLEINDAYLLSDAEHPARNTAEWQFQVLNKGRYEVWLSSITRDTMDLNFDDPVIVTFENKRITEKPVGNEIVLNDKDVIKPYFRADSKLGSIYIEDPGHYNIQVISEKLIPEPVSAGIELPSPHTIVKCLILKPLTR